MSVPFPYKRWLMCDRLTVRRTSVDTLNVSSWLTKGTCARVYDLGDRLMVLPAVIPTYMQGITLTEIQDAARTFLANESK